MILRHCQEQSGELQKTFLLLVIWLRPRWPLRQDPKGGRPILIPAAGERKIDSSPGSA